MKMIHARVIDQTVIGDGGMALDHILDLAGPEIAPRLMGQMVLDLQSVQAGLRGAADGLDWAAMRAHSHVLISLAGTMGAVGLQADAVTLNEAAHDADGARVQALLPDLMVALAALIAMLTRWQGLA